LSVEKRLSDPPCRPADYTLHFLPARRSLQLPTLLTAADWIEIQRIFDAVVELPPEQRPTRLNDFFASHPHLRTHIESLLEAAGESSHLSAAIGTAAEDALSVGLPSVGDRLGPYLINRVVSMGRRNTQLRPIFIENKS
jgi:hypothetical protein